MNRDNHWLLLSWPNPLLRARRERPRGRRAADERDKVAPFHCPMPPVRPTGRIAHLGTAHCCIHPPGRNETIAVTPPIIFSKDSPKQATPLPHQQPPLTTRNRFTPNFRGWGLDENLKPKSPPYRGAIQKSPYRGVSSIARIAAKQIVTQTRSKKC
jgi:hypothetical protein